MAAPKVTQSKVTPGPSTPPGSLTVTLAALEYQSGHAAARIRRSQMTSAGALMTMSLWANRSARSGLVSAGQWMWADRCCTSSVMDTIPPLLFPAVAAGGGVSRAAGRRFQLAPWLSSRQTTRFDQSITVLDSSNRCEELMELRQLEYFVAVAGERSFTRAAQRLHVVQSAVSAAITALEKDLRVVLIERNARRVQLTEAGEALLPEAQAVLDAALAARDAVEGLSRGLRGTLRVGMLSDLGLMDLPGLARDFRDRHPGVELQLRDATAGSSGPLPREYAGRTLLHVLQLLAVPAGHALAGRRAVGIRELEHETFIDLPPGFAMRTVADEVFAAYGMRRAIAAEVSGIDATAAFVRAGVGIAILPGYAITPHANLRAVKVREHDFRWSLNAVVLRRRRLTAAAAALLQLADAHRIEQPGVERPA